MQGQRDEWWETCRFGECWDSRGVINAFTLQIPLQQGPRQQRSPCLQHPPHLQLPLMFPEGPHGPRTMENSLLRWQEVEHISSSGLSFEKVKGRGSLSCGIACPCMGALPAMEEAGESWRPQAGSSRIPWKSSQCARLSDNPVGRGEGQRAVRLSSPGSLQVPGSDRKSQCNGTGHALTLQVSLSVPW